MGSGVRTGVLPLRMLLLPLAKGLLVIAQERQVGLLKVEHEGDPLPKPQTRLAKACMHHDTDAARRRARRVDLGDVDTTLAEGSQCPGESFEQHGAVVLALALGHVWGG